MKPFEKTKSSGGGLFLKLEDGVSQVVVLAGDWFPFEKSFKGGPPAPRWKINVIVLENKAWVAKIFEYGAFVNNEFARLSKAGWNLEETFLEITKTGVDLKTKYSVTPSPRKVDAETLAFFKTIKLHDLTDKPKNDSPGQFDPNTGDIGF